MDLKHLRADWSSELHKVAFAYTTDVTTNLSAFSEIQPRKNFDIWKQAIKFMLSDALLRDYFKKSTYISTIWIQIRKCRETMSRCSTYLHSCIVSWGMKKSDSTCGVWVSSIYLSIHFFQTTPCWVNDELQY